MNAKVRNQIRSERLWLFLSSFFLLPSSLVAQATVYGYVANSQGGAGVSSVQFNLTAAMNVYPIFEYRQSFSIPVAASNGYFVATNVLPGYYNVVVGPSIDTVPIAVPNNTNAYNFLSLQNTVVSNLPPSLSITDLTTNGVQPGYSYEIANEAGKLALVQALNGLPLVSDNQFSIPPNSYNIAAWGDSLTYGNEDGTGVSYPGELSLDLNGRPVFNGGVGGQTSTQIAARETVSTGTANWTTIIWAGRDNYSALTTVTTDISNMVAALGTNTNYLVLSVINAQGEGINTTPYTDITNLNASLSNSWYATGHYLDVRHALVTNYNPNLPQDVTDFENDIPPNSLVYDGQVHLNAAGYTLLATWLARFITNNLDPHPLVTNLLTTAYWQQMLASPFAIGGGTPSAGTFLALTVVSNMTFPNPPFILYSGANGNHVPDPFLTVNPSLFETYLGFNCGGLATTGSYDTAFGNDAMGLMGSGSENSGFGANALENNSSGFGNSVLGKWSMLNNTIGSYNTGIGDSALFSNVSGSNNAASGFHALYGNTNGQQNTATGASAMGNNTSGSYNTATGAAALQNNASGVYNTATGIVAMQNNLTGVNNTANGAFALYALTSGSYNLAEGMFALEHALTASNLTALGYQALLTLTNGTNLIAIGENSGLNLLTGLNTVMLGFGTLNWATSCQDDTAIGWGSMFYSTNPANDTAVGHSALEYVGNGIGNTAIGFQALANNGSNYNTAIGWDAGYLNTNGSSNIYVGNTGNPADTNVIRIGQGQAQTYFPGTVNATSFSAATSLTLNGSTITTWPSGGGGAQTPWTASESAAAYNLFNLAALFVGNVSSGYLTNTNSFFNQGNFFGQSITVTNSPTNLAATPSTISVYNANKQNVSGTLDATLTLTSGQLSAAVMGTAGTNLANAIGLAGTNLANAIGSATTNWASLIGSTISNLMYSGAPPNSVWANATGSAANAGFTASPVVTTITVAATGNTGGFIGNAPGITNTPPAMFYGALTTTVATSPYYYTLTGGTSAGTQTKVYTLMSGAYVLTNLWISTYDVLAGTNLTITVYTNGVATGISASITNSAGTANLNLTANDSTHIAATTNGMPVDIVITQVGTPAASIVNLTWSLGYHP